MGGIVYEIARVDDATPPTLTFAAITDWETSTCEIVSAFADEPTADSVIELVACDESVPAAPTAIAAWIPQEAGAEPDYFAHGVVRAQGPVGLSAPVLVSGLLNTPVYFGSPADGFRCAAVVPQTSTGWSELCWSVAAGPAPSIALIDGAVAQLDLSDESAPTGVLLDVRGLPSTGCSLSDIIEMYALIPEALPGPSAIAIVCDARLGTIVAGSTLLRSTGADGFFVAVERADRFNSWKFVDIGTDGERIMARAIPTHAVWSAWPGQTTALPANEFRRGPLDGQTFADVEAAATALVAQLNTGAADEFPADATVVLAEGHLVVIESAVGGDDSVSGTVDYVHLDDAEGGGLTIGPWFVASICGRGGPEPQELCI